MSPARLGVKVFAAEGANDIAATELIPVFHRWIQEHAVPGVLIDVADYSHVHEGPGVMLIGHEGDYALDERGGRRGLVYWSKRGHERDLATRLQAVARAALAACERLAGEPELAGRLAFRGDALEVAARDRLAAPNSDATWRAFEPAVAVLATALYPGLELSIARERDPKAPFAVTLEIAEPLDPNTLLTRLAA